MKKILFLVCLLLCLLLRPWLSSTEKRFSVLAMIVIALLAAGLRVFLALRVAGYSVDRIYASLGQIDAPLQSCQQLLKKP